MSRAVPPAAPGAAADHPLWLLSLAALLAWQAWMTLGLFDARRAPASLLDDRPILSGRHPLHLYHGHLGARTLLSRGGPSCYDPAFHAGYPKTPVFDGGSRPAEVALAAVGGGFRPDAYKAGLAACVAAVPLLFWLAARGLGLPRGGACLATTLGLLVWWGGPCRDALEAGDVDLLLATLLVLLQFGLLVRYHRHPCPLSWLGVVLTCFLGWLAHPLLLALLLPAFLVYYVSTGTRHGPAWHLALLGGLMAAVACNAFWLIDWVRFWWVREPLKLETPLLAHRTLRTLWEAPLWGCPADRALACGLVALGVAGTSVCHVTSQRPAARLFGLVLCGFAACSVLGIAWEPAGRLGAARLAVPTLLFACPLAAVPLVAALRRGGPGVVAALVLLAAVGVAAPLTLGARAARAAWSARLLTPAPFRIGLGPDERAVVEALKAQTTAEARILWEDRSSDRRSPHWAPLLPLLTGRSFVGGLDPDAGIEHTACGLVDGVLAGRPLSEWSDAALRDYCTRYNVGWVATHSAAAAARLGAWPDARLVAPLGDGALFAVRRRFDYCLRGKVERLSADAERIVLGRVEPAPPRDGRGEREVVLSLHYHTGLQAWPERVRIEPEFYPDDPIPFVRLRLDDPAIVTLTWRRR
jgi:hypothetical protein